MGVAKSVQVLANGISSDGELRSPRLHGFVERPELANPVLLHNDLQDLSPPRAVLFLEGAQVVAILLHAEVNLVLIACRRAHGAVLGEVLREGVLCRRGALLLCLALRLALSFARLALCLDRFRVRILGLLRVWLLWLHWLTGSTGSTPSTCFISSSISPSCPSGGYTSSDATVA